MKPGARRSWQKCELKVADKLFKERQSSRWNARYNSQVFGPRHRRRAGRGVRACAFMRPLQRFSAIRQLDVAFLRRGLQHQACVEQKLEPARGTARGSASVDGSYSVRRRAHGRWRLRVRAGKSQLSTGAGRGHEYAAAHCQRVHDGILIKQAAHPAQRDQSDIVSPDNLFQKNGRRRLTSPISALLPEPECDADAEFASPSGAARTGVGRRTIDAEQSKQQRRGAEAENTGAWELAFGRSNRVTDLLVRASLSKREGNLRLDAPKDAARLGPA